VVVLLGQPLLYDLKRSISASRIPPPVPYTAFVKSATGLRFWAIYTQSNTGSEESSAMVKPRASSMLGILASTLLWSEVGAWYIPGESDGPSNSVLQYTASDALCVS